MNSAYTILAYTVMGAGLMTVATVAWYYLALLVKYLFSADWCKDLLTWFDELSFIDQAILIMSLIGALLGFGVGLAHLHLAH